MGILFSFINAFGTSAYDIFGKKTLKETNEYFMVWVMSVFIVIMCIPIVIYSGIPIIDNSFWVALIICGSANSLTNILYLKAIKTKDLSVVIPIMAFSPIFVLVTANIILGEVPNVISIIGVFIIVFGSYFLNIKKAKIGIFKPFSILLKDKESRLMLLIGFIYSITASYSKIGIQSSSPIFWLMTTTAYITIITFPLIVIEFNKNEGYRIFSLSIMKKILICSSMRFCALFSQMIALNLMLVSHVISIKRFSIVFSVIIGSLIFKEKNIKERTLGMLIMVLGVLLMTLYS